MEDLSFSDVEIEIPDDVDDIDLDQLHQFSQKVVQPLVGKVRYYSVYVYLVLRLGGSYVSQIGLSDNYLSTGSKWVTV